LGATSTDTGPEPDEAAAAADLVRRIAGGDDAAEGELAQRYRRGLLHLLRHLGASPELAEAVAPAPSQLQSVLVDEEAEMVRRLIGELPTDRDRQLLLRFYVGEEDKERICADLGLDSLHFNRVLFRARQRFKELLERSTGRRTAERPVGGSEGTAR